MSAAVRLLMLLPLCAIAAAGGLGCSTVETQNTAVEGAAPVAGVPLGPVPGPGSAEPLPVSPYARDPVALEEGRRLFVRFNCSGCHGGHAGGGMGPSLRDPEWLYGSSGARIHDSIARGRAHGMPAWGTTLPDDYLWKLTAYIQALGTADEAQPPQ